MMEKLMVIRDVNWYVGRFFWSETKILVRDTPEILKIHNQFERGFRGLKRTNEVMCEKEKSRKSYELSKSKVLEKWMFSEVAEKDQGAARKISVF